MHINAKRVAFLGILSAISVIFVVLAGVLESSTIFFVALGSFGVGIANREYGRGGMIAFFVASIALNFILAPNKLYCITYAGMCLYLLLTECAWEILDKRKGLPKKKTILWIIKFIIFNMMYLTALFIFPEVLFPSLTLSWWFFGLAILGGQVIFILYDMAYHYTQVVVWNKLRKNLHNN